MMMSTPGRVCLCEMKYSMIRQSTRRAGYPQSSHPACNTRDGRQLSQLLDQVRQSPPFPSTPPPHSKRSRTSVHCTRAVTRDKGRRVCRVFPYIIQGECSQAVSSAINFVGSSSVPTDPPMRLAALNIAAMFHIYFASWIFHQLPFSPSLQVPRFETAVKCN